MISGLDAQPLPSLLADLTRAERRLWDLLNSRAVDGLASLTLRRICEDLQLSSRSYICSLIRFLRGKGLVVRRWFELGSHEARVTVLRGENGWPELGELPRVLVPEAAPASTFSVPLAAPAPPTPGADRAAGPAPGSLAELVAQRVAQLEADAGLIFARVVGRGGRVEVEPTQATQFASDHAARLAALRARAAALPPEAINCVGASLVEEIAPAPPPTTAATAASKPEGLPEELLRRELKAIHGTRRNKTTEARLEALKDLIAGRFPSLAREDKAQHQLLDLLVNLRRGKIEVDAILDLLLDLRRYQPEKVAVTFASRAAELNRAAQLAAFRSPPERPPPNGRAAPFRPFPN